MFKKIAEQCWEAVCGEDCHHPLIKWQISTKEHAEYDHFGFKKKCFYCGNLGIFDPKHLDCKNFEEVKTKLTKFHSYSRYLYNS